ncbi:unnamed protein product [Calypogeia fissa]
MKNSMAEDDYENSQEACIGKLCFSKPYQHYTPPPYYPRISRREYRWKVGAQVKASPEVQCKISHAVALPNILGLGKEGRWWWQWIPISLMTSVVMHFQLQQGRFTEESQRDAILNPGGSGLRLWPRACLKAMTPVFGKLALQPMVELLPTRTLMFRRHFCLGTSKLSLQTNLEIGDMMGLTKWPQWSLRVNWHPADAVRLLLQPGKDVLEVHYSRSFNLSPECRGVATGLAEVPNFPLDGASRLLGSLPLRARLDSFKVSHIITDKAAKTAPLPTSTYLKASRTIGTSDLISIIPGHWIDPGFETGAPGERDFSMDVANVLERQLMGNGWKVLRPDRDSPNLTWEEYLNWVSKQTSQGIPVLEIHGQGSKADPRGFVLGAIGDANAPLNKELAKDFGYYKMNWTSLGVPKRGGVILESFNSDEVLKMAPWQRKWSVRRLASRIVTCIERASHENRVSRGVIIDAVGEDDILAADNAFVERR